MSTTCIGHRRCIAGRLSGQPSPTIISRALTFLIGLEPLQTSFEPRPRTVVRPLSAVLSTVPLVPAANRKHNLANRVHKLRSRVPGQISKILGLLFLLERERPSLDRVPTEFLREILLVMRAGQTHGVRSKLSRLATSAVDEHVLTTNLFSAGLRPTTRRGSWCSTR